MQNQEPNTEIPAGDNPVAPVTDEEPGLHVRRTNWWLIGVLGILVIGIALYVRAKMNQSASASGTTATSGNQNQPTQVTYNITVNNGSEYQPTPVGVQPPGQIGTPPPGGTPPTVSGGDSSSPTTSGTGPSSSSSNTTTATIPTSDVTTLMNAKQQMQPSATPTIPVKQTKPMVVAAPPPEVPTRPIVAHTPTAAIVPHPAIKAPALPAGRANSIASEAARQGVPNPLMNPTANTTATLATKPTVLEKQAAQIQTSTKVPIGERTALASQLRRTMVTPMRPAKKATPAKVSPHVVKLPTKPTTTEKQAAKVTSSSSMPLGARTALANRLRF